MTRRGSLAYYGAAVVVGSLFLTLTYYPHFIFLGASPEHWPRDLLFVYFFVLMLGCVPHLLLALILRRAAHRFGWISARPWMLAGMVLLLSILGLLAGLGNLLASHRGGEWWRMVLMFLLVGPMYAAKSPLWLPLPAGAATGFVLHRIHRAFEPPVSDAK